MGAFDEVGAERGIGGDAQHVPRRVRVHSEIVVVVEAANRIDSGP